MAAGLRPTPDVTLNDSARIMLSIVILALSVGGVFRYLRQAHGTAQPLPWAFWTYPEKVDAYVNGITRPSVTAFRTPPD